MKKSIGSGRGSVYSIILKALQSGDKYGYEICKEIEEKTNGSYILKQPSLYSGLKRLEAQGDVKSYWRDSALGGRRHYYSLTESGKTRLENSNFNWQDARDDIVDSLFEKSQLDKTIDDAKSDIEKLNSLSSLSDDNAKDIDDVLKATDDLIEEQNTVVDEEKDDLKSNTFLGGDLFSMFNSVREEEHEAEDKTNMHLDEKSENVEENSTSVLEHEEKKNKEFVSEDFEEQNDLFSIFNQTTPDKASNIEETNEVLVENNSAQNNDFADIEKNLQTVVNQSEEKIQENKTADNTTPFDDEIKNLTTFEFEQNKDEENVVILQKNEDDALEKYRSEHLAFGRFTDNIMYEKPENNFSNFEDLPTQKPNDSLEQNENIEQLGEKDTNLDSLFEKINDEKDNIYSDEVSSVDENEKNVIELDKEDGNTESQSSIEEKPKVEAVDYKDIFGDLMSERQQKDEKSSQEIDDEFVYNKTFENVESPHEEHIHEKKEEQELPRINQDVKDINRTLMFDLNSKERSDSSFERYEPYSSADENPFEKYDSYQSVENLERQEKLSVDQNEDVYNSRTKDLSFDKKYANTYNRFEVPDYEVRYFRKENKDNTEERFLSINKLNLVASFVLCILILIATTITLVNASLSVNIGGFQLFLYVASYLIAFAYLLFDFLKYSANKNKKVKNLGNNQSIYGTFFAIMIVILTISINLLAGMTISTIMEYSASFILPIVYAVMYFVRYPIKKFLSKFSSFYN